MIYAIVWIAGLFVGVGVAIIVARAKAVAAYRLGYQHAKADAKIFYGAAETLRKRQTNTGNETFK